jgi:hypothetical protein
MPAGGLQSSDLQRGVRVEMHPLEVVEVKAEAEQAVRVSTVRPDEVARGLIPLSGLVPVVHALPLPAAEARTTWPATVTGACSASMAGRGGTPGN